MKLVVFGDKLSEVVNISYCIDHAFESHRQKLITMMEKLGGIVHQLQGSTNGGLDSLFQPIHTRIINFAKMVPGYWEHNEEVLREIIQPFRVPFVYAILPHAEEQQLEYDHTFANSYPPRESEVSMSHLFICISQH